MTITLFSRWLLTLALVTAAAVSRKISWNICRGMTICYIAIRTSATMLTIAIRLTRSFRAKTTGSSSMVLR